MPPFGVTPNAQRILHEFSLTGRMDLSFHNIWEVLSAAQTLRIESAVISCEQFLSVTHSSHFSNIVPQPRLHLDCSKILPFTNGNPNIAELKVQPSLIGPNHSSVDLRHLRNLHCFSTFFREEIEKQSGSEKPSINGRSSACEHSEQMKSFVGTLEIAVCDGPISFKRVPNEFYQQDREATASDTSTSTETTADISLLPKPTPISKQKKVSPVKV